ncbi:hypothetical protein CBOM_01701 [Ceraceosorus bombacis]|uniref:Uncharacterized protein n=1 Tax=Ceraceosorus bombacis TaxID=401625 RepID=A0A0P1BDX9_9BASI|nr:hypothetical protein CBOM_01701 [Ceraceosorus bombacis]
MARFTLFLTLLLSLVLAFVCAAPAESIGLTQDQDKVRLAFRNASGNGPNVAQLQSDFLSVINTKQNPKFASPILFSVAHARIASALSRIVRVSTKDDFEIRHEVEAKAILNEFNPQPYNDLANVLTGDEVKTTVEESNDKTLGRAIALQFTALQVLWANAYVAFSIEAVGKGEAQDSFNKRYYAIQDSLTKIINTYNK